MYFIGYSGQWRLGSQIVKNLQQVACKFDLDQSEHKSMQVHMHARHGQMELQVDPSFQLASTQCDSVGQGFGLGKIRVNGVDKMVCFSFTCYMLFIPLDSPSSQERRDSGKTGRSHGIDGGLLFLL